MGPEPFESKLDFSFQDLFELGVVLQGMMDCSMVAGMLSSRLSGFEVFFLFLLPSDRWGFGPLLLSRRQGKTSSCCACLMQHG